MILWIIVIDCYWHDVVLYVFHRQNDDHTLPTLRPEYPFDLPGVYLIHGVFSKRSPFVLTGSFVARLSLQTDASLSAPKPGYSPPFLFPPETGGEVLDTPPESPPTNVRGEVESISIST